MSRTLANRSSAFFLDGFYSSLSMMGRALPWSTPSRYGVEVTKNVSYGPHGAANHLDIWRLKDTDGPMPVVLYIHGGGFRALHKGTHWLMALMLARRGYLVVNINYRLSPEHAYPAHLQDVCAAWLWTLQNAPEYGGDTSRMVIAGESAGANLTMALTIACCYPRPSDGSSGPAARTSSRHAA